MSSPHDTTTDFTKVALDTAGPRNSYASAAAYQDETAAMNADGAGHAPPTMAATHPSPEDKAGSRRSAARLALSPINFALPVEERGAEVQRLAIEAFPQCDNWVNFYRELLGVDGVVRKLYTTLEELRHWEESAAFAEVHTMLAALRSHDTGKGDTVEAQRMITVRLPMSMHEALKQESKDQDLSINKLCITKLLHKMDSRFVPQEPGKRRGRKPGPQGKRSVKVEG